MSKKELKKVLPEKEGQELEDRMKALVEKFKGKVTNKSRDLKKEVKNV